VDQVYCLKRVVKFVITSPTSVDSDCDFSCYIKKHPSVVQTSGYP